LQSYEQDCSQDFFTFQKRNQHEMSFTFQWPRFSDEFYKTATEMLNTALNKGKKPPIIADRIEVVELEMGTQVCAYDYDHARGH
jgi:hypothetical protein